MAKILGIDLGTTNSAMAVMEGTEPEILVNAEGENLFYDENDPLGYNLSDLAKHYIAGILKYAPEFCLITNQYVNSYKRLMGERSIPSCLAWARTNRSTLLRVPGYRPHRADACRIELRSPDPAANPYLAFAVMLAAGLAGIEEGLTPDDPIEDRNLFDFSLSALQDAGLPTLPMNLGEAVDLFEKSDLMREVLGEHIHSYLVQTKRAEWMEYLSHVSPWELDRYLAVL